MTKVMSTCCSPTEVQDRSSVTYRPRVDIVETADDFRIEAELPGVPKDGVEVRFEDGKLLIQGKLAQTGNTDRPYFVREYGVGDFAREFRLGEGIDHEAISAETRDGVLFVQLPKVGAAKPRKIDVR